MSIEDSYNFKAINPALTTSGVVSEEQLRQLSAQGYRQLINLLPNGSEYSTNNEQHLVESQKITYVYIPVDFSNPTPADYQAFADAMIANSNLKTHIHCAANYRVSAFFGIYAHQQLNWSPEQVRQHIESLWKPEEHAAWRALLQQYIDGY
ncbi:MAG: hypothetical protein CL693_01205 [Cellvibrionaceae bacterium]|nr:hypothetical protein [Cellvibrionaceae bacterium]|tara:strand:+ start:73015 stop:73467 length:453 start_codon:yes stop_codon:yes gene_type:complete